MSKRIITLEEATKAFIAMHARLNAIEARLFRGALERGETKPVGDGAKGLHSFMDSHHAIPTGTQPPAPVQKDEQPATDERTEQIRRYLFGQELPDDPGPRGPNEDMEYLLDRISALQSEIAALRGLLKDQVKWFEGHGWAVHAVSLSDKLDRASKGESHE